MTQNAASAAAPWGPELPLVGRRDELAALHRRLRAAIDGRGHCLLLTGEAGVGKSRLLATLMQEARDRDMIVAAGSAFAVEAAVPFGAVADALSRPLRALDHSTLTVLARGAEHDLRAIVPGLAGATVAPTVRDEDTETGSRARLLWNVTQFLTRLAARQPVLLILDNAHESDTSSLELLHFIARQVRTARILIVLACTDDGLESHAVLRNLERSLLATDDASRQRVESLTRTDLAELLQRTFALDADAAATHADTLWSHTRGNPFFVEESLKALAAAGRIRIVPSGWLVESAMPATLPPTVRDGVRARLDALHADERRLIEIVSVAEGRVSLPVLDSVSRLDSAAIADAVDALCARRVLVEHRSDDGVEYEVGHPIIQATVRSTLTAARERALHAALASALETVHGDRAIEHAGAIARHLVRGTAAGSAGVTDPRALRYLAAAGHDALARRANPEAARWLQQALAVAEARGDEQAARDLLEPLATARGRMGDPAAAADLWQRALQCASEHDDHATRARLLHLLAQQAAATGDAASGLTHLDTAEQAALSVARIDLVIRIQVARAKMQQALGRHADAVRSIDAALIAAEAQGDAALRARAHQTALQLYAWTGPAGVARHHGAQAITLADTSGDREVAWAAHWAMAMLEGFTGDADGVARHLRHASALADALSSPALQAMTAEIEIEHASGIGRWDDALALAERTIPLARAIMPRSLLPRLLVWTGLIVLERDDTERAGRLFEEAWQLSGAATIEAPDTAIDNVHNVILAHTGMGIHALSQGNWSRALDYGERGLALADRFGYVAWAIHRLIPMLIEAALRTGDYDRVEHLTVRLRAQSHSLGHRLGLAWATAAEALVARVRHHRPDAAARLLAAAEELEAVPFVFHGARMRRNAAQVLEADGDVDGAARELRRAHDVFARLGAEFELRGTRSQLRALGMRVPPRTHAAGAAALTGRELEIARAVARRLTNKEIGTALDISARTVSTHLSRIFEKMGVDSRGALADAVREHDLLDAR